MNDAERQALILMRDRWMTGGLAAALAPAEWQQIVASAHAGERERLLLAIAGQAFDVALRPAVPQALTVRPALPVLGLPGIPERLRPLFRTALKVAQATRSQRRVVIVVEARGFAAHPLDWMPAASDDNAPRTYAPWVDWQAKAGARPQTATTLDSDSWDDFYPAERRNALADLRRIDPAAARTLLEGKAGGESADARLPLVELLQVNLSADDAPYLLSLSSDRSSKVRQLAARLLARIGRHATTDASASDARELADFVDRTQSGVIRRQTAYVPKALKSQAQINRRNELLSIVPLLDLASALDTTERGLVDAWQLGSADGADTGFVRMVSESGIDDAVRALGTRLIDTGDAELLGLLLPRLDEGARRSLITIMLSRPAEQPGVLGLVPDSEICSWHRDELMSSVLYASQRAAIAAHAEGVRATDVLGLFGCLAVPEAANAILADLTAAGIGPADPALALLRLNAALAECRMERL